MDNHRIGRISLTFLLGLTLSLAGAVQAGEGVEAQQVREELDGTIRAGDLVFSSWSEYARSDYFRETGRRCGSTFATPELQALSEPPAAPLAAADCEYNFTNPAAEYDPSIAKYAIAVVVHVIQSTSGSGLISEALVRSQIDILNEDFLALAGTNGAHGTDIQIEFFLATEDPDGNPTSGITYSTNNSWFNDSGNYWDSLAWDPTRYINIYTNTAGGDLGYVPDLPQGPGLVGTNADRVVILWSSFGRDAPIGPPFNLGRTTTHEVGHYLGLDHTFAGGCAAASACASNGDRICDTNPQSSPSDGCEQLNSCGSPDPIHNYLDYSDDSCMTEFTPHQARRMRCSLEAYRPGLYRVVSDSCGDGIVDAGEECDDGNNADGDGCDAGCDYEHVCGDGLLELGEECDDGNLTPADGCEPDCTLGPICGDGIVEVAEQCDDGNLSDGDGCDGDCELESVCGNGIVEALEECDDHNTVGGDGCSAACQAEAAGNCCDTGHGTGCSQPAIEECVCDADSYCCDVDWDNFCVAAVEDEGCGSCTATLPAEISLPGAASPVVATSRDTFQWEDKSVSGSAAFNLYRGSIGELSVSSGSCFVSGIQASGWTDPENPAAGSGWFYLVTGRNSTGEGPLGVRSSGVPRPNTDPC